MSKSPETKLENRVSKRSFWRSKIEEWRQSGLSQPVFCQQQKLKYTTFRYWQTRQGKKIIQNQFVKVETSELIDAVRPKMPAIIQVRSKGGLMIQLPNTMGVSEIAGLIHALEKSDA